MNALRIRRRKAAYQRLFPVENGQVVGDAATVLADLARFCGATRPAVARGPITGAIDPNETLVRAARLEVFQRIAAMIHLPDRTLFNLQEGED